MKAVGNRGGSLEVLRGPGERLNRQQRQNRRAGRREKPISGRLLGGPPNLLPHLSGVLEKDDRIAGEIAFRIFYLRSLIDARSS
jgi:hypothetical protein